MVRVLGLTAGVDGKPVLPPAAKGDLAVDLGDSASSVGAAVAGKFASKAQAFAPHKRPNVSELRFTEVTGYIAAPLSVDSAGWCYGAPTNGALNPMRSNNGWATAEAASNPTTWGSPVPASGTKLAALWRTSTGYVAVFTNFAEDWSRVYYSTSFTSPWYLMSTFGYSQELSLGRGPYTPKNGAADSLLLVGEYGNQDVRRVHISEDGGQAWRVMLTRNRVDPDTTINNHIHSVSYDPYKDAIWVVQGDGLNCWFAYTTNQGATWTEVPAVGVGPEVAGSQFNHPTIVAHTSHKVITTPDGVGNNGVWGIDRDTLVTTIDHEIHRIDGYRAWARAPWAQKGDELYIVWQPDGTLSQADELVMAGSGDGGRSWHTLLRKPFELGTDIYSSGLVGPDTSGRLFYHGKENGVAKLYVAQAPKWEATTPTAVHERTRDRVFGIHGDRVSATPNVETGSRELVVPENYIAAGDIITARWVGTVKNATAAAATVLLKVRAGLIVATDQTTEIMSTGDLPVAANATLSRNFELVLTFHALQSGGYRWVSDLRLSRPLAAPGQAGGDNVWGIASGTVDIDRSRLHRLQLRMRTLTTDPLVELHCDLATAEVKRRL